MCSSVVVKGIYVPRNDLEFVKQAVRPLREVLCLEADQCTDYITDLENDHKGISQMCKQALDNEAKRIEQEKNLIKIHGKPIPYNFLKPPYLEQPRQ